MTHGGKCTLGGTRVLKVAVMIAILELGAQAELVLHQVHLAKEEKMDHYSGTSDIDPYLAHFKLAAKCNDWPIADWVAQLALKLSGEAQSQL